MKTLKKMQVSPAPKTHIMMVVEQLKTCSVNNAQPIQNIDAHAHVPLGSREPKNKIDIDTHSRIYAIDYSVNEVRTTQHIIYNPPSALRSESHRMYPGSADAFWERPARRRAGERDVQTPYSKLQSIRAVMTQ
jgi:hypothetical protein